MGSAVIEGYMNENKDDFVAYASPENDFSICR